MFNVNIYYLVTISNSSNKDIIEVRARFLYFHIFIQLTTLVGNHVNGRYT